MVLSYAVCMNAANAYGTGYVDTGSPGPTLRSVAKSVPGSHSTLESLDEDLDLFRGNSGLLGVKKSC